MLPNDYDIRGGLTMPRVKQDGLILNGLDGTCILVRGDSLPEAVERAREWAAEEDYVLTDPAAVRLEWIRRVPCPPRNHGHDGWDCPNAPDGGSWYSPSRGPGRGAFRGVLAEITHGSAGA
jgi:hypothetical protein